MSNAPTSIYKIHGIYKIYKFNKIKENGNVYDMWKCDLDVQGYSGVTCQTS